MAHSNSSDPILPPLPVTGDASMPSPPIPSPPAPPVPPPVESVSQTPVQKELALRRASHQYSINDLMDMFGLSRQMIHKRLKSIAPDAKVGKTNVWHIARVCRLADDAELHAALVNNGESSLNPDDELPTTNLPNMTPAQLKTYFQTVEIQQGYLKKRRENLVDAGKLVPIEHVRKTMTGIFKIIGTFLDTLPDVLERDGIVHADKIDDTIEIVDTARGELAMSVEVFSMQADDFGNDNK